MPKPPLALTGKVVVITGGARGIGAATADLLSRHGARVAIGDLDEALAKTTAGALPGEATGGFLDVTDHAGFTSFLDEVERTVGPIDVLVNNAGIMPLSRVGDESPTATRTIFDINVLAVIHGTKEAARRMQARGAGGHIVNISSAAGRIPLAGASTYVASKYAVSGFSNSLHIEFMADGVPIEVTAVHPAIVRTELSAGFEDTKAVRSVTPQDVAEGVLSALQHPRPDVYVPSSLGAALRSSALMPRRLGEWVNRVLGGERAALDAIDRPERRDYEERVSRPSTTQSKEYDA